VRLFSWQHHVRERPHWPSISELDTDFFLLSEWSQVTATLQLQQLPWKASSETRKLLKELELDNFVEEIDAGSSLQRSAAGWPCCLSSCVQPLHSGEEKAA